MNEPVDNCGSCLTPACAVPVAPYAILPVSDDAVRAWYRCLGCGHGWFTSRILGAEETERVLSQAGAA